MGVAAHVKLPCHALLGFTALFSRQTSLPPPASAHYGFDLFSRLPGKLILGLMLPGKRVTVEVTGTD
jgi:hypothetical protein